MAPGLKGRTTIALVCLLTLVLICRVVVGLVPGCMRMTLRISNLVSGRKIVMV